MAIEKKIKESEAAYLSDRFESGSAEEVLQWTFGEFDDGAAICTSFQTDGVVIIDMAHKAGLQPRVFTIDSGRLPEETFELIDKVRDKYRIDVEVYTPESSEISEMVTNNGVNLFYGNVTMRMLCCEMRKVKPLNRVLASLDAWVTGLRRDQSTNRSLTPKIQIDPDHGNILKVSPLADWSEGDIWRYIHENDVPFNDLYNRGYTSIGCAPCTRPIAQGEDSRAGRWWWENGVLKECGIHLTADHIRELIDDRVRD